MLHARLMVSKSISLKIDARIGRLYNNQTTKTDARIGRLYNNQSTWFIINLQIKKTDARIGASLQ